MIILFFLELLVLFFLSRALTSHLSFLLRAIFRSNRITIILMAIIFLPGTIVHEFAHAIMAKTLFVYVGHMDLMPQLHDESLKLGSVEVGKTDIVRNFLIGIAPFIVGTSLLLLVLFYSFTNNIFGFNLLTFVVLVFTFVIANTMYSSRKDMEGAVEFFLLVVVPIIFLYFIGVRIPGLTIELLKGNGVENFFKMSAIFLAVPLFLDLTFILFAKLLSRR